MTATLTKRMQGVMPVDTIFLPIKGPTFPQWSHLGCCQNYQVGNVIISRGRTGAACINARETIYEHMTLEELRHPQPCTKINFSKTTTEGVIKTKSIQSRQR